MRTRGSVSLISSAILLLGGFLSPVLGAEMRLQLYGSIVGFVTGPAGAAQMGATVYLLNRYDQLLRRTYTNERGAFGFDFLLPDAYSIRVVQTSFAPAAKQGIRVDPGHRSFLSIQLASVVSSIKLVSSAPRAGTLMTDDWKWVLRSTAANRPVLRFQPDVRIDKPQPRPARAQVFSETRGMFTVTSGETGNSQAASIADTATAFALSTSLLGASQLMFTGNVGYSPANGVPAAAFRTVYRHSPTGISLNPEVRLTVQQVFLPMHSADRQANTPLSAVRSLSIALSDAVRFSHRITAEFGTSLDSVSFLSRMNYLSPWLVTTIEGGTWGRLQAGYRSGVPSPERGGRSDAEPSERTITDLPRHVAAATLMPRVTLREGRTRLQRAQAYELSYTKEFGPRMFRAGFFQDSLADLALTIASDPGAGPIGDVLPDFNSTSGVFNIGDLRRAGFTAQASQRFGDWATLSIIFDRQSALRTDQHHLISHEPEEIRQSIRRQLQNALATRLSGVVPKAGAVYTASYQWTDYRSLTPGHVFLTNLDAPLAGLNVAIRQSLPAPAFLGSRMEISAELRNLLAQGYLPLDAPDGRRILLIHSPRTVRGGVSFFF